MTSCRRWVPGGPLRYGDADGDDVEWLVTNGIGGYASGTVSGKIARRFHGCLISALAAPLGRMMMLNHLAQRVRLPNGSEFALDVERHPADEAAPTDARLVEFRLEDGLPTWRWELGPDYVLERSLVMPHRQNTVYVRYHLVKGEGVVDVELYPWVNFRPHEGQLDRPLSGPYSLTATGKRYEISTIGDLPVLRLLADAETSTFFLHDEKIVGIGYGVEKTRGYDAVGDLYTPGFFRMSVRVGGNATLTASTEAWAVITAMTADEGFEFERARRQRLLASAEPSLRDGVAAELVFAADSFVITAIGRTANQARSHAQGDEIRTVIAGYHWFTDWGRDTMISLEGLTLTTGRYAEARYILRTFSHYVKNGLIPNNFPEGDNAGVYYTADATLWFFHAADRYLRYTGDRAMLDLLLPILVGIVEEHVKGTLFGIKVDPKDGLLHQGSPEYPLTWMDAKLKDLIVTPRRGKAVEINALYYNALVLLGNWVADANGEETARPYRDQAERLYVSFNQRFWNEKRGYLYDIVDGENGDDDSFRPNQLFAISLPHPVLDPSRWQAIVKGSEERLLTPRGLRSLAPDSPDYKGRYFGDLRARDLAYHQGTVWGWLIGPFVDAWLKVHPDDNARARGFLEGFSSHLGEACVGSISEVFDAEAPHAPRGCVAQAWSVAEVLRLCARLG